MAKAMRTWADLLTLPKEHPLQACRIRTHRRFASPLSRIKERANGLHTDRIEMIAPYILPHGRPEFALKIKQKKESCRADSITQ
jgi:hypothetical protein